MRYIILECRTDSRLAPSQWGTSLQSNAVSHWPGANLLSALKCSLIWLLQTGARMNSAYAITTSNKKRIRIIFPITVSTNQLALNLSCKLCVCDPCVSNVSMPWIGVYHGEMDVIQYIFHITSGQINTWKGVNQLKELFFLIQFFFKINIFEIDK